VNSRLTEDFLACYARLPASVRDQARRAYWHWLADPAHPGVQFKRVHATDPVDSARVGLGWRAPGLLEGGTVSWFWDRLTCGARRNPRQAVGPRMASCKGGSSTGC